MRLWARIRSDRLGLGGLITLAVLAWPIPAQAQLRIVNYNTAEGARTGIDVILQSIGEEIRNGFAKPIDVLALEEQTSYATTTQAILNELDGIYGPGIYDLVELDGNTTGGGLPGLIYNTTTIQVIDQDAFGSVGSGSNQQPRATLRYRLRPVGYDSSADFYIYNSHYKADTDATSQNRRLVEANSIRTNLSNGSNALGEGAHVIYTGDFNMYTAGEPAFQKLLEAGNGQAFDPQNLIQFDPETSFKENGEWSANPNVAFAHTQAPCFSGCPSGFTTGGMDDRFDFQLSTAEFQDGEGLSLIGGSYHPFGNNGSLPCCNSNINSPSNTVTFPGVSFTQDEVLNALWAVTDHIPLVADYQLPAVLNAVAGSVPTTLNVGEIFNFDVTVNNAANVLQPIGADELDYSVTTSGDLIGSYFNEMDAALGGGNVHQIGFSRATPGMKSGMITVASGSQAVQNAVIQIPISYQVVAARLYGDYNNNQVVDAADYTVWRAMLGLAAALANEDPMVTPGNVTLEDYAVWKAHFGEVLPGSGAAAVGVPEPGTGTLLVVGVCLVMLRLGTLTGWTRTR